MKITKAKLESLKGENKLYNYCIDSIIDEESEYREGYINDLLQHGCQSGMVGELIYYSDTVKFFKKYKLEINELLSEMLSECGFNSPKELFGDKWNEEDPLAQEEMNQNLLAWFGYEESVRQIANDLGLNI